MFYDQGTVQLSFPSPSSQSRYSCKGKVENTKILDDGLLKMRIADVRCNHPEADGHYHSLVQISLERSHTFNFIEIAFSRSAITSIDDGLKPGNLYYIGAQCLDKKLCDFTKVLPDEAS